jgi:Delta7-sterol 5-desaturase
MGTGENARMDINIQTVISAFAEIFAVEGIRYVIAVGLVVAVIAVFIRPGSQRNLHAEPATARQKWREFGFSMLTCAIFSANGLYVYFGLEGGWVKIYEDINLYSLPYLVASLVGMVLFHDAYFYWTHRLIHHRVLFRWVHHVHHKSLRPTAWATYSFAPAEAFISGSIVPLWVTFVPTYSWVVFIFLAHMILRNAIGHSGFELFPRNMPGSRAFGFITNVFHHDLHHRDIIRGNFGLYFTWWDRWMGTEHPDYTALVKRQRSVAATGLPAE